MTNPTAVLGSLCVYAGALSNATLQPPKIYDVTTGIGLTEGASKNGALLLLISGSGSGGSASGTWAVTGN